MALKTKTPRFKDIGSGEMNTGGAPIFADDILRVQENNRKDYINSMEALRSKLPLLRYGTTSPTAFFQNGLILSGCEYDNTDTSNPVISPGFILSGGEVCFYPGGTYNTGPSNTGLIYIYKGAEAPVSRVFNDGNNKEILTSFGCTVETASVVGGNMTLPTGTGITLSSEVVVISCGVASSVKNIAEDYFTQRAALKITDIATSVKVPAFSSVTLATGWSMQGTFAGSRVNADFSTTIFGIFSKDFSGSVATFEEICTLSAYSCDIFLQQVRFPIIGVNNTGNVLIVTEAILSASGVVSIVEPSTGWPTSGTYVFNINTTLIASTTAAAYSFEVASNFLDIT